MDASLKQAIERQKNKAIASILQTKEDYIYDCVDPEDSAILRKSVLDELNFFASFVFDIIEHTDNNVVYNEKFFDLLSDIHDAVTDGYRS